MYIYKIYIIFRLFSCYRLLQNAELPVLYRRLLIIAYNSVSVNPKLLIYPSPPCVSFFITGEGSLRESLTSFFL